MTDVELAWAAGLFEGEGTIRISRPSLSNWGAVFVSVVNTDKQIIDWFHYRFAGYVKSAGTPKGNRRDAWVWLIASKRAIAFLESIKPFIVRDAVRAKIDHVCAFQSQKQPGSFRWRPESERLEYAMDQWNAHWWMCELNRRGRPANACVHQRRP